MDFLKKIYKKRNTVVIVALLLMFVKVLGFIKLRVIAGLFGADTELDLFWAAFLIPDTIFSILVAGTINAAIIPIFSDVLHKKGEGRLVKLFTATSIAFVIISVLIVGVLYLFVTPLAEFLLTSGTFGIETADDAISYTPEDLDLLVNLMKIMLLSPLFLGLSSVSVGFLQTHKKFFITTLAPLLYNLGIILGAYLFVQRLDMGVIGLAWAVVLGSLLNFGVQLPITINFIRKHLHIRNFSRIGGRVGYYSLELVEMLKLALPRVLALLGENFNSVINTLISFSLPAGALSAYKFAFSLHLFPVQIFSFAMAQVIFPDLAQFYTTKKFDKFRESFRNAFRYTMFVIFPSTIILVVLRLPIVRLVLGVGEYDWWDTVITSWALALLAGAVIGHSLVILSLRGLYAIHETMFPLLVTIIVIVFNLVTGYYFTNFFSHYQDWRPIVTQIFDQVSSGVQGGGAGGLLIALESFAHDMKYWFTTRNTYDAAIGGLALSLSLSFLLEMVLNTYYLHRRMHVISWSKVVLPGLKMFASSLVMAIVMYFFYRGSDFSLDTTKTINVIYVFVITLVPGGIAYIIMSKMLGVEETDFLFGMVEKVYLGIRTNFENVFDKLLGR